MRSARGEGVCFLGDMLGRARGERDRQGATGKVCPTHPNALAGLFFSQPAFTIQTGKRR